MSVKIHLSCLLENQSKRSSFVTLFMLLRIESMKELTFYLRKDSLQDFSIQDKYLVLPFKIPIYLHSTCFRVLHYLINLILTIMMIQLLEAIHVIQHQKLKQELSFFKLQTLLKSKGNFVKMLLKLILLFCFISFIIFFNSRLTVFGFQ